MMNRKNFIRTASLLTGASVMSAPLMTAKAAQTGSAQNNQAGKVTLKKGLGFGMIREMCIRDSSQLRLF